VHGFSAVWQEELTECGGWLIWVGDELQPGQTPREAGISEARLPELYAASV
jgi:hypothetical protein